MLFKDVEIKERERQRSTDKTLDEVYFPELCVIVRTVNTSVGNTLNFLGQ